MSCFRIRDMVSSGRLRVASASGSTRTQSLDQGKPASAASAIGNMNWTPSTFSARFEPIRVCHGWELPSAEVSRKDLLGDGRLRDPPHGGLDAEPLSSLDGKMESDLDSGGLTGESPFLSDTLPCRCSVVFRPIRFASLPS